MHWFYMFSLIPMLIGLIFWIKNHKINIVEWILGSIIGFIISISFHVYALYSQTDDIETWSGQIVYAKQFSAWREYYEEAIYRTETIHQTCTDANGDSYDCSYTILVFDHWESRTRWHDEYFMAYSNIDTNYNITKSKFEYFVKKFNNRSPVDGVRTTREHASKMIGGDPFDYEAHNRTGWIEPVTKLVHFENRIKAAPSVFSFVEVPEDIPVFAYPKNENPWLSDRLMGVARHQINPVVFDQFNSKLGPKKKVNIILIGFDSADATLANWQEAKWIGGKKNDLVICYGPSWVKVFGWSQSDICKRNIETIFLTNPINNEILDKVYNEIVKNYQRKDWSDWDYIDIEPRQAHFIWYFTILILGQISLYIFFYYNRLYRHENAFDAESWEKD